MPVLPAVASTTRPPGLISPRFSASRIICLAGRSFTDWPGFMNSALPRMVQPVASDARLSLISGVPPIASTTPSRMGMGMLVRLVWRADLMEARRGYKACPGRANGGVLLQQPGGLLHDRGRGGVDVLDQRLDRLAGNWPDFEIALAGVG